MSIMREKIAFSLPKTPTKSVLRECLPGKNVINNLSFILRTIKLSLFPNTHLETFQLPYIPIVLGRMFLAH